MKATCSSAVTCVFSVGLHEKECVCVFVCLCVCLCVCVWERERERNKNRHSRPRVAIVSAGGWIWWCRLQSWLSKKQPEQSETEYGMKQSVLAGMRDLEKRSREPLKAPRYVSSHLCLSLTLCALWGWWVNNGRQGRGHWPSRVAAPTPHYVRPAASNTSIHYVA